MITFLSRGGQNLELVGYPTLRNGNASIPIKKTKVSIRMMTGDIRLKNKCEYHPIMVWL